MFVYLDLDTPQPNTKVGLQRFLSCINFFHRFLPGIANTLAPLHALTSAAKTQNTPVHSHMLRHSTVLKKLFQMPFYLPTPLQTPLPVSI